MLGNWLAMKKDFSLLLGFLENFKYLKNIIIVNMLPNEN
jgi:hypothetical protein